MNYSEVKKELKKEFESFLKPLGYKSKSGAQGCSFFLDKGSIQYKFGYGVANYIDEFNTGLFGSIAFLPLLVFRLCWCCVELKCVGYTNKNGSH